MTKLITLATLAAATLTACAVDSPAPIAGPDAAFTLEPSGFIADGSRWLSETSGPMLGGSIHVTRSAPRAFIDGKPVGAPAIVHDGQWQLQLPEGTITAGEVRVVLELDLVPGEPELIEQTFALAE